MTTQSRHLSAYLDDEKFAAVSKLAKERGRTLSGFMKWLIERELDGAREREDKILANQVRILIGVDALLKHHTDPKLFGVVIATRRGRLGSTSDEA